MTAPKKGIVLDLDSTIISSLNAGEQTPNENLVYYTMYDDEETKKDKLYYVHSRPHLQEFLDFIFSRYNVGVWTAASKDYAISIVQHVILHKPERKLEFLLFNQHAQCTNSSCPKDLRLVFEKFQGFPANNTYIIDDYNEVFAPQLENAYPIKPFEADEADSHKDTELITLMKKLVKHDELGVPLLSEAEKARILKKNPIVKVGSDVVPFAANDFLPVCQTSEMKVA